MSQEKYKSNFHLGTHVKTTLFYHIHFILINLGLHHQYNGFAL